jgi:L-ascorbate metabolism protein UlaG (beta-lactamase superfamily)
MDLQFFGANCIVASTKNARVIVDNTLTELGQKNVPTKDEDIVLFTNARTDKPAHAKLAIDSPGEYEASNVSIVGIPARAHMDEADRKSAVMYKIDTGDLSVVCTGHIYPELSEDQLETIGKVDVLFIPVGGNGYTLDPVGALKVIKAIEPKLVVPTNYADKAIKYPVPQQDLSQAIKELSMEPKETVAKLRLKSSDLSDTTQLIVLERS